jgi:hypothetical protein
MHQVGECLRFLVGCEGGKRRMEGGMSRAHSEQILWVMVLPMFDREMAITCTDIHASHDVDRDVYSFVISLDLSSVLFLPRQFRSTSCYQKSDLLPCPVEPASGNPPVYIRRSLGN